jgi:hypothetical protein
MPKRLGNLIALPLQNFPRRWKQVFVDGEFRPYVTNGLSGERETDARFCC